MEYTVAQRVAHGIGFLDTWGPENWRDRINLKTLDIGSLDNCVFGQVFREWDEDPYGWDRGYDLLCEREGDAPCRASDFGFDDVNSQYGELNGEWIRSLTV